MTDQLVAALLRERTGLIRRNHLERLVAVDEALAALGIDPDGTSTTDAPAERAIDETPIETPETRRRTPRRRRSAA